MVSTDYVVSWSGPKMPGLIFCTSPPLSQCLLGWTVVDHLMLTVSSPLQGRSWVTWSVCWEETAPAATAPHSPLSARCPSPGRPAWTPGAWLRAPAQVHSSMSVILKSHVCGLKAVTVHRKQAAEKKDLLLLGITACLQTEASDSTAQHNIDSRVILYYTCPKFLIFDLSVKFFQANTTAFGPEVRAAATTPTPTTCPLRPPSTRQVGHSKQLLTSVTRRGQ